jgi:hypothetical protein
MNLERYGLLGLVAPGVICGLVLLLAWASREGAAAAARGWLGAMAVGAAYLFGQAASFGGLPEFPPLQSSDKIFWLTAGAIALSCVESLLGERLWPRRGLRALCACGVIWLLLERPLERVSTQEALMWVLGLGAALLCAWTALGRWAELREGVVVPLVLAWVTAVGSGCLLYTGTAKIAQFAGILVAVLCAAAVVALLRPSFLLGSGAAGIAALLCAFFWISGVWFSGLPVEVGVLLALAPFAACLAEVGPLAGLSGGRGVLVRLGLSSALALPALFLAWVQQPPPNPYG